MKKLTCLLVFLVCFLVLPKNGNWSLVADDQLNFIDKIKLELLEIKQKNKAVPLWKPPVIDFDRLNSNFQNKMSDFFDKKKQEELESQKSREELDRKSSLTSIDSDGNLVYLTRIIAGRFGDMVLTACEESPHEVDPLLIVAIIKVESDFDHRAVSQKGAKGLMQLMPVNYKNIGINPFDPAENIQAGVLIIAENLKRYEGNVRLALAAYNAGPRAVDKHGGIPPFKETRNYVRTVLRTHQELQKL